MGHTELIIRLTAGLLLTAANAFFVVTEFSLTRLPQFDDEAHRDDERLRYAWKMVDRLEIYLTGCQLGITTTSILLGIVAEPAVTAVISPVVAALGLGATTTSTVAIILAVVVINLVHKIWGEQAPTYLGVEKPVEIARLTAPIHFWWTRTTYPFIILGDSLAKQTLRLFGVRIQRSWTQAEAESDEGDRVGSRTELKRKMASLLKEQDIPHDRQREVMRTLDIGDVPVRDVMVPRERIVALRAESDPKETLRLAAEHMLTRYPVKRGDEFVGTLYVPALLKERDRYLDGEVTLESLSSRAVFVDAGRPVSDFIDLLQERGEELGLITENGRVVGLMTITDAFEQIAGQVRDPFDVENEES